MKKGFTTTKYEQHKEQAGFLLFKPDYTSGARALVYIFHTFAGESRIMCASANIIRI